MRYTGWFFALLGLSLNAYSAGNMVLPKFEKWLADQGVAREYHPDEAVDLRDLLQGFKANLAANDTKDAKRAVAFYSHAIDLLEASFEDSVPRSSRSNAFLMAKRILYSVKSKEHGVGKVRFGELLKKLTYLRSSIPYVDTSDKRQRISWKQATKEARFLKLPGKPGRVATVTDLAQLSHQQIADLDIGKTHPVWNTASYMLAHPTPWRDLENWAEARVSKKLRKKLERRNIEFSLKSSRKVLFFKKIKDSATSPKMDVKDAYSQDWKLKWGGETQTEPVANRLYIYLGGKFNDFVYANAAGKAGLTLVLGDANKPGSCENINSRPLLEKCYKKSSFKFDITPYIYSSGVLNPQNIDQVLDQLVSDPLQKYSKPELIGRSYVTFKESLAEFKSKSIMLRGGPAAGSFLGAPQDRVARGLFIFNFWIKNYDLKDENNKGFLLNDFRERKHTYVESQHDLGVAFATGNLNKFKPGRKFVKVTSRAVGRLAGRRRIIFKENLLYEPKAFKQVTYADALWMAQKIADLPTSKIKTAVASSGWPDFVQTALLYKLQARRQQLAEVFGITKRLDQRVSKAPTVTLDFSTRKKRRRLARHYGLSLGQMEQMLRKRKLLKANGTSKYRDQVLKEGEIASCKRSLIVNLLEKYRYPSGLSRRWNRHKDDKPLKRCKFKG